METLSKRTQSLLMNAGINSLQELSEYTAADLLKFRNFGYKSLQEVEPYLKTFDFTIKSDNTETLENALEQIEKLKADKKELVTYLENLKHRVFWKGRELTSKDKFQMKVLIEKHKQ